LTPKWPPRCIQNWIKKQKTVPQLINCLTSFLTIFKPFLGPILGPEMLQVFGCQEAYKTFLKRETVVKNRF
jgi:hypothetical protein